MSESELTEATSKLHIESIRDDASSLSGSDVEEIEDEPRNVILGMLSQIKKGMDLHRVPFPTFVLEPRSMLERLTDFASHPQLILTTPKKEDGLDRFLDVVKYYLSGWHVRPKGAKKPYNPTLGEVFRCRWKCPDGSQSYYISEQVAHHPPTSAYFYANPNNGIVAVGNFSPRPKFLGNSIVSVMNGYTQLHFISRPDEKYVFTYPNIYARGLFFGKMFLELGDDAAVECEQLDLIAEVSFKVKGYFSGSHNGVVVKIKQKSTKKVLKTITGKWCDKLYISEGASTTSKELFLDVETEPICSKTVSPESDQDELESRRLWHGLTKALKERDYNKASAEKNKVEDSQRRLAKLRTESGISWHPKFFNYETCGFWNFSDRHVLTESKETLVAHLEAIMKRRDFDFKTGGHYAQVKSPSISPEDEVD